MNRSLITVEDAQVIARLINLAAPAKDYFPSLTGVRVVIDSAGRVTGIATDRHTLIRASLKTEYPDLATDRTLWLSPALCKFILAAKQPKRGAYTSAAYFEADLTEETLTLSYNGSSFTDRIVPGNYPDVASLLDSWKPAERWYPIKLDPATFTGISKALGGIDVDLELGESLNPGATPAKPGALKFMAVTGSAEYAGLTQPKLR